MLTGVFLWLLDWTLLGQAVSMGASEQKGQEIDHNLEKGECSQIQTSQGAGGPKLGDV